MRLQKHSHTLMNLNFSSVLMLGQSQSRYMMVIIDSNENRQEFSKGRHDE
jgi:hypothetical protein